MIELQNFGWNAVTVSFVILMAIRVFGIVGASRQSYRVWSRKNADSLSWFTATYFVLIMVAETAFGADIGSIAMLTATIRIIPQIVLVVGICKFRSLGWPLILFMVSALAGQALAIFYNFEGLFFTVVGVGLIIAVGTQPLEIWRNRSAGNTDIFYLSVFLAGSTFWLVYGIATDNIWLMIVTPPQVLLNLLTVILWLVYRQRRSQEAL